jgi:S1-C subfamily serine protease
MTLHDLSEALSQAAQTALAYVVAVRAPGIVASGVSLGGGHILTAARGLRSETVRLTLPDGSHAEARLVGRDRATGLALLHAEGVELPAAPWAPASPKLGEIALILGRGDRPALTWGLVKEVGGAWTTARGATIDAWIDVDATLPWGFPGGPLVDARGGFVGINVRDLTEGGTTVPASTVARVVERLRARGEVTPGFLGVGAVPARLGESQAARAGQGGGLLLVGVDPDGPAGKGGLGVGDVLLAVDGAPLLDVPGLQARLTDLGAGHTANFRVLRGESVLDVGVTLAPRPRRGC